jgi:hypothetical protein
MDSYDADAKEEFLYCIVIIFEEIIAGKNDN